MNRCGYTVMVTLYIQVILRGITGYNMPLTSESTMLNLLTLESTQKANQKEHPKFCSILKSKTSMSMDDFHI